MKCDVCGTESTFDAGFVKERRSFRTSIRTVCPRCHVRQRRRFEGGLQIAVLIEGVIGYVLLWRDPGSLLGRLLTGLFLINLFLVLTIIPHELGHVIVGRLVGWRVFSVVIGVGKRIFKFRYRGIIFSFHSLPVCGLAQVVPVDARGFHWKRFLVFLAGPAVNAALAAIALGLWWNEWRYAGLMSLPRTVLFFVWANFWVAAANLWPFQSKHLNLPSDGKQLLKTFSTSGKDVEELSAARYALEAVLRRDEYKDTEGAQDWCNRGLALYPNNIHLLTVSGLLCLDRMEYSRARDIFVRLLSMDTKPGFTRSVRLNNIAYVDVLIGDPALLPEADAYSQEAYEATPWTPSIVGTRGTVLVELGQFEVGIKLLKESFEHGRTPRSKADNACHLAIAYFRMGDRVQADNYLKLARQLDSQCRLIERAESEFRK